MNRGTVVFLALAVLLAHTLAIYQTPDGGLAQPFEISHVAYRVARNLVYEGEALWNPGGAPVESYPSVAWILVNAVAARLYLAPNFVTQGLGFACALATAVVLAQFSPRRSAGLIAPLLLAASGSAAAAAASGTEATLAMLLATAAFLAFERGARAVLAVVLGLLVLTRPEGVLFALAMAVLELRSRPDAGQGRRRASASPYLVPLAIVVIGALARLLVTGVWHSPYVDPLLEIAPARWRLGALYLWGFVYASGFGLLFVALPVAVFTGRTSPMGRRALALTASWWGLVVLTGGDDQTFWTALVPVLPLFFLGLQECLREGMDRNERLAGVVWSVLLVTMTGAFFVSKVPGDFGPLRLEAPHTRWQTPTGELARNYPRPFGRLGLLEEARAVEHLRTLGVFLRNRVSEDATIATFWPGAVGYLSRKEVLDLSGRAWPLPGRTRPFSWHGHERIDLPTAISPDAEYLVPLIGTIPETFAPTDFLRDILEHYDVVGPTEERMRVLLSALRNYELVSVPVPMKSNKPFEPSDQPFPLLRRKDLGLAPHLTLEVDDAGLRVLVRQEGHQQVVDLCLRLVDRKGRHWYLRPTGEWTRDTPLDVRTGLLLFPTGSNAVRLLAQELPPEIEATEATAWLHNPGMRPDAPLAPVGLPASVTLR